MLLQAAKAAQLIENVLFNLAAGAPPQRGRQHELAHAEAAICSLLPDKLLFIFKAANGRESARTSALFAVTHSYALLSWGSRGSALSRDGRLSIGSGTTGALPVVRTPIWREYKPYPVLDLPSDMVESYHSVVDLAIDQVRIRTNSDNLGCAMGYKIAQIDELRQKLLELPEVDDVEREVTKQEAVRRMADAVSTLQKRGYSMEKIAEIMTTEGLAISVQTLKSYLTRARSNPRSKPRRKVATSPSPSSMPEKAKPKESSSDPKAQSSENKNDGPETSARSSSFTPRQDSDDI